MPRFLCEGGAPDCCKNNHHSCRERRPRRSAELRPLRRFAPAPLIQGERNRCGGFTPQSALRLTAPLKGERRYHRAFARAGRRGAVPCTATDNARTHRRARRPRRAECMRRTCLFSASFRRKNCVGYGVDYCENKNRDGENYPCDVPRAREEGPREIPADDCEPEYAGDI